MRAVILAMAFMALSAFAGNPGVFPEQTMTPNGITVVRIANALDITLACYIQDQHNYTPFHVYPRSYSLWYPVHGQYRWQCQY
jgi:hypothetical protein